MKTELQKCVVVMAITNFSLKIQPNVFYYYLIEFFGNTLQYGCTNMH